MRRSRLSDPENSWLLTSPSWSRCEGLIKAFEEALRSGQSPAIADYLGPPGETREALLVELIHVELEFRLKAGQPARVESYLSRYPELAANRVATLDLIAAEYETRQLGGSAVVADEYSRRFPELREDLLHRLRRVDEDSTHGRPRVPGYEIIDEIGRGGMGVVYKAVEPVLGRHVALKFLPAEYARDQERLDRFRREARTTSALNHPHICTVHALGEHEGRLFIVMEFIEGVTVRELAARKPGVEEVVRVVRQAARALAAAHAAGVVHRDVKPENVMVREDGYVKVLDFGLARHLPLVSRLTSDTARDTDPGTLVGTAAYMSPEQSRGEPAESASDVFSLGILLYQLVTGRHPFEADSMVGILYAIATRQPVPASRLNPEVPPALDVLIEAMLHKDACLRPTAAEVATVLTTPFGAGTRGAVAAAPRPLVRRELELAALRTALAEAAAGRGGFVCVAGEPGIGKTALVEAFLDELSTSGRPYLIARGHCSERRADTEAYLPVIDALSDLLRGEAGVSAARLMKVVAPTWYAQAAPTTPTESGLALSQQAMLREFCNLLDETPRLGPVVLFLDDVHWADPSTVDLLAQVSRRCRAMRVLVIVTYRLTELLLGPHPFHAVKLELQAKGGCTELFPNFLNPPDIKRYLELTFPGHAFPADFADLVHARTEGSPLFVVDLLRYLRDRGVIAEADGRWTLARDIPDLRRELPESVRSVVQRQLERLNEGDRKLLAAAAVQGQEFDSAVVAAALGIEAADVEDRLQVLDRVHGLVRLVREDELPDRTLTLRYVFVHGMYRQALDAGLSPSRRVALGASLARALESHQQEGSSEAAAALACLYEVGRDFGKAARQFWKAAHNTARVFAHREAAALARRGLRMLESLPQTPERAALELPLQTMLGLQLQVTEGYAAPEACRAYTRARELFRLTPDSARLFPVLWGLWLYSKVRSELPRAAGLADELLALARQQNDPDLALQAHQALGITALCRGELPTSQRNVEQAVALYDPRRHHTHSSMFGQDPLVICKAFGAVGLWLMGYPDSAESQAAEAVGMSRGLSPNCQAVALFFAAMVHQLRRDAGQTRQCATEAMAVASEHGFSFWLAGGGVLTGWALTAEEAFDEGLDRLRQGIADWLATDSVTYLTYYLGLQAEVLVSHGRHDEALRVLKEALALVDQTGECFFEAELYRLRGEALIREPERAEGEFRKALEIAHRQEARSLELRAAMRLTRLVGGSEARELLARSLGAFTEGLATRDLLEARVLVDAGREPYGV